MKLENIESHIPFVYVMLMKFQKCSKLCTVEVVTTDASEPEL